MNVDRMNMVAAAQESPSTDRFYLLSQILRGTGEQYEDFRNGIISLTGIASPQQRVVSQRDNPA
jgi:hypothetical protein